MTDLDARPSGRPTYLTKFTYAWNKKTKVIWWNPEVSNSGYWEVQTRLGESETESVYIFETEEEAMSEFRRNVHYAMMEYLNSPS